MTSDVVIDVHNLRKTYGATVAVADVSLRVRRGTIFGILGPNGAGKTTTLETIVGLTHPDAGRIRVLGLDPQRDAQPLRQVVGVQLQQARLPARLRVREALELYASFYEEPARPSDLMDLLGLRHRGNAAFADLSGGEQQRLSIALALVGNPRIAVLDELTTGLDPHARRATWELIEGIRDRGVTVLLVTHHMDEAARLCDELTIIDQGRVVAAGTPAQLADASTSTRYVLRFDPPLPASALTVARAVPGVEAAEVLADRIFVTGADTLTRALLALAGYGITPVDIRSRDRTLEDVFLGIARATASA